jgi:DNA-binding NtrC family response regulator
LPPKRPTSKKKESTSKGGRNKTVRILVVDDEPDFARMVGRALVQDGYRVDEAVTARKAIELQHEHAYDLAVVDLKMPEMTGLELLQYFKVRDKKMSVMIMTAYGSLQVGIDLLRKGACDYLSKPFKLDLLRSKVHDAIARRRKYLEAEAIHLRQDTVDEY